MGLDPGLDLAVEKKSSGSSGWSEFGNFKTKVPLGLPRGRVTLGMDAHIAGGGGSGWKRLELTKTYHMAYL